MITKGQEIYNHLIHNALREMSKISKRRKDFLVEVFVLFLSIKGKINFLQLSRYGKFKEQRYRQQFEKPFDFLEFNKQLVLSSGGGKYAIAFDPSYINKSGKKTPGVGYFWSGVAGKTKWGLEIGGIAAIDINNHTAFHLEAVQTLMTDENTNLVDWYVKLLIARKDTLSPLSSLYVSDAYFAKYNFVTPLCNVGMHLISRFRDDADLLYLYQGSKTGKKGRPKKYAGKIFYDKLNEDYFTQTYVDDKTKVYSAVVHSKSLKRKVRIVIAYYKTNKTNKTKWIHKIYFSTDITIGALDILDIYKSRFQIEFLYRDAKQHTGLNDSQARSENKLDFHFNASLTSVNIAKASMWLSIPKHERNEFSMNNIKTMNHNMLMMNRFFDVFGINPYSEKNKKRFNELLFFGTRAA